MRTFSIAGDGDDSSGYKTHASWPPSAGTFVADEGQTMYVWAGLGASVYEFDCGFMRFDLSALPAGQVVSSARLIMYCTYSREGATGGYSLVGDEYDFGGEPAVGADWRAPLAQASSILEPKRVNTYTAAALNDTFFNAAGRAAIAAAAGGFFGVRICLDSDVGAPITGDSAQANFSCSEHSNPEPQLEVVLSAVPIVYTPAKMRVVS